MLMSYQVVRLFCEAAQMSPEDSDVHIVLGVLYNLSREYDKAIASFKTALQLKPKDYSLWNKLGATQANSIQSADAILAYQQVLSFKHVNLSTLRFLLSQLPEFICIYVYVLYIHIHIHMHIHIHIQHPE